VAGRPLVYHPRPRASVEVNQLRQALIELINRAETTLSEIAESEQISGGLKTLSRQLNDDRGPDKHIVLAVVRHCALLVSEPAEQLTSKYTDLWDAARRDYERAAPPRSALPGPPAPEPPDPALVEPVLELVADGDDGLAATVIAKQYPEAGPAAGGIIAEIARRVPDGAAGLLAAIIDHRGYDVARAYMESFSQADEQTAARVLADPRLKPPPPSDAPGRASILDKDPADLIGQRRAAKVRQGSVAQVVADIIQEAQFESLPADDSNGTLLASVRRQRRRRADPDGRYDILQAADLVLDVVRNSKDGAVQILGRLLNALAADGHVELAARVLGAMAGVTGDGIGEVLDVMSPPALVKVLELLAWDHRLDEFQSQTPSLMARARPLVLAQLLLEQERRNSQTPAVDFSQLRTAKQVLAEMLSRNALLTASFIGKKIKMPGILGLSEPSPEETGLVAAVRDLAPSDLSATGQLLGRLLSINIWDGIRFVLYLAAGTEDDETLWMAAEMLAAAIRLNPSASDHIISLARKTGNRASIDMLLDHLIEKHPDQGREVVDAMLARADPASTAIQLRGLLRSQALALAGEMLRQIPQSDPRESWDLVALAVKDGNLGAAIDILERTALSGSPAGPARPGSSTPPTR